MEKVGETLREKILIVQDPPSYLTPTSDFLSSSGYATALVEQSARALDKVDQESPDLVILDLGTSSADGLELLARLKSDRFTHHIPVIILGTPLSTTDGSHWIDSGADDYIDYPYHLAVLYAHIRALLRRSVIYDPVTHLPAGTYLKRQVDVWLSKNMPTSVLYVDIDHFASYNSAYGREAGDRVLQHLARLIVDVLPRGNLSVGHLGEDDFMMAFPPAGTETIARTLIDRFAGAQREFYNEIDFAKRYLPELDPSLPSRNWPLMTLSAAVVTNENQALTNFLQVSSLLSKQMVRVKAGRNEPALLPKQVLPEDETYPTLLKEGHRHFHQRIGKELEQANSQELDQYAPLLGYHFSEAGDYAHAARFFQMAGDKAQKLFAPSEAREHYEKALANLARLPESRDYLRQRTEVATRYAVVAFGSDPPDQILARLTAVESLAQSLGGGSFDREDRLTLARLRMWIGRLLVITDSPLEGMALCQRILDEAQDLGEEDTAALSSGEIGRGLARQGYFGRAIPLLRLSIAYLEKEANWQQWTYLAAHLAMSLVANGEVASGYAHAEAIMKRAVELGSKSAIALCHLFDSFIYMLGGEPDKSLAASRNCAALAGEAGEILLLNMAYGLEAWGESRLGHIASAEESLALQEQTMTRLEGRRVLPDQFAAIAAEVALRRGDAQGALTLAQKAVDIARQMRGVFAEGLGEIVWAKALAASTPWRYEEVERHLVSAVNAFEAGECQVEAARARVVWGLLASAVGKGNTAREQLEVAASQFEAAGLSQEAIETHEIIPALVP